MANESTEYLTVRELAELLRVRQRKVYALAAAGEIACSRVTGKLLFPRVAVEQWIARHSSGPAPAPASAERPAVLAGSHDPLLEWSLRESRSGLASFFDGSLDGLARFVAGGATGAGLHLADQALEEWNRGAVTDAVGDRPVVLLEWAWRERGFIIAPGNPHGIQSIEDLPGHSFVARQPEAGSQLLFERLLSRAGLSPTRLTLSGPPARGEQDVALAVAEGRAEAGFGLAAMARQFRLGFVPLLRERYDLLLDRRAYFEPALQALFGFCRDRAFAEKAEALGGYDISGLGQVHFNGP